MKRISRVLILLMISTLLIMTVVSCKSTEPSVQQSVAEQPVTEAATETPSETVPAVKPEPAETPAPVVPAEPEAPAAVKPEAVAPAVADKPQQPVETDFHLYVLHTNDTHGRVLEGAYDGMGFAKISTIAGMYREQADNVLLLDAGDAMHGTTLATLVQGESIAQVMNTVGYDAMAAGNHDFNYGYERLIELNEMTDFPILSANTYDAEGSRILPPYTIFTYNDVKVAVFGITTSESYYKVHPKHIEGLTFADSVQTSQEMVDTLSSEADVIIALVHLGVDEASTDTSIRIAEQVSGIDLIVDGHSHTTLPEGLLVNDTLIVQAGSYDKSLGAVDIHIVDRQVAGITAQLYSKEQVAEREIADDPAVLAVVEDLIIEQDKITNEVVAFTNEVLDGEREQVRTRPTNLARIITSAMVEATGADCAITNGGGIRASIQPGEVTMGEIISVLPFNNTCVVVNVTGEELYQAVEHGLSQAPEPNGAYSQLGNLVAIYNIYNEPGNRVYKLKINGETVDKDATYSVATNDFMAAGGDGYTMFAGKPLQAEVGTLDGVLIDYMKTYYPIP
ncbi:MAG: 5'-nucleotidase C-terminal domain-containing protein [Spirochaetia bacterium]|nr:5'-nucleotidase C-terminal domain-containing protein [Spirochaetia bacterium]